MIGIPPLALTMGEPAGIGGELTVKAWARRGELPAPFFAIDDPARLELIAGDLGQPIEIAVIKSAAEAADVFANALPVLPLSDYVQATPGKPSAATAPSVIESIERAVRLTEAGEASAVVTNPIQKDVLYASGFAFPGHTEYLAALTGISTPPVMMLASPMLRVVPVTVHLPLKDALKKLKAATIVEYARIAIAGLRKDFGIERPRVAIAGVNPHAGENGSLGKEDGKIVAPAIAQLEVEQANVFGPVPPDALFTARARAGYDVAICMYHDQALIPIKALDVDNAVNVTLGLPIIRTSPDHGTALDIAGKGIADPTSLMAALRMAAEMSVARNKGGAAA